MGPPILVNLTPVTFVIHHCGDFGTLEPNGHLHLQTILKLYHEGREVLKYNGRWTILRSSFAGFQIRNPDGGTVYIDIEGAPHFTPQFVPIKKQTALRKAPTVVSTQTKGQQTKVLTIGKAQQTPKRTTRNFTQQVRLEQTIDLFKLIKPFSWTLPVEKADFSQQTPYIPAFYWGFLKAPANLEMDPYIINYSSGAVEARGMRDQRPQNHIINVGCRLAVPKQPLELYAGDQLIATYDGHRWTPLDPQVFTARPYMIHIT